MQRIWTAATNEAVFLAYRVAIPRHLFRCRNAFSTKCRSLYRSRSYLRCTFRFFLDGMTASIPESSAMVMISLVSYPRSASKYCAGKPSISLAATAQSAVVPAVTKNRTGIPFASTAKCIFVLSPLLYVPCLGCLQRHQPHVDVP